MTSIQPPQPLKGAEYLKSQLRALPGSPGVYRMLNARGDVLYVGKAKHLQKRVTAYTMPEKLPLRLQRMVAETTHLEIILTETETEALLLEANLIKKLAPRYNILLRDDKSFPFIALRLDHPWPQLVKHRGPLTGENVIYFGPYASTVAVNETVDMLQRIFLLRTCSDYTVAHRTRPCLQYHIRRCSAPCVGKISPEAYQEAVEGIKACLTGKSRRVQELLSQRMREASAAERYEEAALFRDRIAALTRIQNTETLTLLEGDIFSLASDGAAVAIQVFFYRHGQCYGSRTYFPEHTSGQTPEEVLEMVMAQVYQRVTPPPLILTSHALPHHALLEDALRTLRGGKVVIDQPKRGPKAQLLAGALRNTTEALARHQADATTTRGYLARLAELFEVTKPIQRIEIYDNSHSMGREAYGVMVVASPAGFERHHYRKFKWPKSVQASDDLGMMRYVLTHRLEGLTEETTPDLILLDGGAGQLKVGQEVLASLGLVDRIRLVAIAKGPERNAGRERFFWDDREPFSLPPGDSLLHYLQRLRDEAHRFAITTHRAKKTKRMTVSRLDDIPGIGPQRKKALLQHFGSFAMIKEQTVEGLMTAPGISRKVAEVIYAAVRS